MKNKKAFTLIELLAVIIILALLMAIAIPMVSKYIEQSRKKTHISTAAAFVDGLSREIVSNNVPLMADSDSIYYIPFNCIPIEKGGNSPHGSWEFAYILMTNNDGKRNYYIYSKDAKGMGIEGVEVGKLKVSDVKSIAGTKDDLISVEGKTISQVVGDTCDYSALITKNVDGNPAGIQPDESCFEIDAQGTILDWKVSGISEWNSEVGDYVYTAAENDPCYTENLIIPSTINGIAVKVISDADFDGETYKLFQTKNLKSVIIPNGVTSIGDYAFTFNQLTNVIIPNSVTSIGAWTFAYNQLSNVTIPNSVTSIGSTAFAENQLSTVTIPNSVTSIGDIAFAGNKLSNVTIPNSVTSIEAQAFYRNQLSSVTIPDSITSIRANAFANNQLSNVTIPNSVTSIGFSAFAYNQLSSVSIPNSVTSIEALAFENNQLSNVTIPNSVTSIGAGAFANNQLSNVNIPNSVTSIGDYAFRDNQLSNVTIPDSVTSIGATAFRNNQLSNVTIPNSVTSIGVSAFTGNPLGTITMQGRENTVGMTLGFNWNGSGTIVFEP